MKRKIAILLAAVMTATVVPMNVMASSSNTPSSAITVKDSELVGNVYLKIEPHDEVTSNSSIILTVENGKFFGFDRNGDLVNAPDFPDSATNAVSNYWEYVYPNGDDSGKYAPREYGDRNSSGETIEFGKEVDATDMASTNKLPFLMTVISKRQVEVKLNQLPQNLANVDNGAGKPIYYLPMNVVSDGVGDVKIKIDSNNTSISGGGTVTIATSTNSSGSTTTTVDGTETENDTVNINALTIRENVKGTFKENGTVKIKVNGGFKFGPSTKRDNNDALIPYSVKPGVNINFTALENTFSANSPIKFDGDELTFTMPALSGARDKAASIIITGIAIEPEDDDEDWGDINLTISGSSAGITTETVKVGERADYNFKMSATEDPKTIVAGRLYDSGVNDADKNDDVPGLERTSSSNKRTEEADNIAAVIKFEELIKNTWVRRNLEFSVPEGVKIAKAEFSKEKNIPTLGNIEIGKPNTKQNDYLKISEDGRKLIIDKSIVDNNQFDSGSKAEFELKLYLSADAGFTGEVPVSVAGAGAGIDQVDDVVVANVIAPISIESKTTKINMGYQTMDTADFTITEAKPGIFLKGEKVVVYIDSPYGQQELGFSDNDIQYTIDGDLKIKNFKVKDRAISFEIDSETTKDPASIKFSKVKIGSTRSVPYGHYDLAVGGAAIINNYDEDLANKSDNKRTGYFDTTDHYIFKDYLDIVTETGTLDSTVKVTIGEKTILIDEKASDMDVAPYIQASSNSTMVPLRFVAVALGVDPNSITNPDESSKVSWDPNTKTVTIYYGAGTNQKIIQFTAGSNIMKVDASDIPMDYGVIAEIKDGRMFVPFRALGQALGVNVSWDADTKTATFNEQK